MRTISHASAIGHRGHDATKLALTPVLFWRTGVDDAKSFVRACIHCLFTTGGTRAPLHFGPTILGVKPNTLLQFDYLELRPSVVSQKYVLLLRDDYSGYCWLIQFSGSTSVNAPHDNIDWCAVFGLPGGLISDLQTSFRNEKVRLVTNALRTPQQFTLPYCPWYNGSVECL